MAEPLVQLNANWRVADDPPQWALRCRDGSPREKASGWTGRKFIRDRDHLLERIDELCGEINPDAIEIIRSWPDGYTTWKLQELKARAGPETAPHSAIMVEQHRTVPGTTDAPVCAGIATQQRTTSYQSE